MFSALPSRRYDKQEERRLRLLERARRKGDADARVMWLLPRAARRFVEWAPWWDDRSEARDEIEVAVAGSRHGRGRTYVYRPRWLAAFYLAYRCSPRLVAFPPAFDDRRRELSHVYLIAPSSYDLDWRRQLVEPTPEAGEEAEPTGWQGRPVVGDRVDTLGWQGAAKKYLLVLDAVDRELLSHWHRYVSELPLRRRRAFVRWRAALEAGYERLCVASDRYRPVFDEITEAIEQTARARAELTDRFQRLCDWEQRRLWRMVPQGDGFLVIRTDVGRGDVAEGQKGKPIVPVHVAARGKRLFRRSPIDWDEAAIDASDGELAELFGDEATEIGRTRSGAPMAVFATGSFDAWHRERMGTDYRSLTDRAKLAEDVAKQEHASIEQSAREPHRSARHGPRGSDFGGGFDVSVHT